MLENIPPNLHFFIDLVYRFFFVNFIPLIVIVYTAYLYFKNKFVFEHESKRLEKEVGKDLFDYTTANLGKKMGWIWGGVFGIALWLSFTYSWTLLIVTFFVWGIATGFIEINKHMKPIITQFNAMEDAPQQQNHEPKGDFDDSEAANDGFGFDESRFKGSGQQSRPEQDDDAPRGYDKRHPDDAKLWAIVDDPEASDGERRNAMDMILKRQARRRGGNGGGGGGQEDPEKQSGRTNLLGSKRRS